MNKYRLTSQVRIELKRPLGTLIAGSLEDTADEVKSLLEREKPARIVVVGDSSAKTFVDVGIHADLYVVDNRVMRVAVEPVRVQVERSIEVSNPSGTISAEAWNAIEEAMRAPQPLRVVVDGEEDLLTLPAILCAPDGSIVFYGQPGQGVVAVRVNAKKKREIRQLIDRMERVSPRE